MKKSAFQLRISIHALCISPPHPSLQKTWKVTEITNSWLDNKHFLKMGGIQLKVNKKDK